MLGHISVADACFGEGPHRLVSPGAILVGMSNRGLGLLDRLGDVTQAQVPVDATRELDRGTGPLGSSGIEGSSVPSATPQLLSRSLRQITTYSDKCIANSELLPVVILQVAPRSVSCYCAFRGP